MSGWDEWFRVAGDYLPPSGIAVYKNRRKAPHLLAFPLGEGGPRQRWIGCFRKQLTCAKTFFHLHHLSLRSAPPTSALRAPPSKGRRDRYTQNALHSRPFLWKGLSSKARQGWLPPVCWKCVSPVSLSPPLSGIALYKNRRGASLHLSLPHRGRGTASAALGYSR